MPLQAALLRGVNLGKRQVIMSELRDACEGAGFANVRTLLASGNLVLDAEEKAHRLEKKIENVIEKTLGLETDVFVRASAELEAIVRANPFKTYAEEAPSNLVVFFMRAPPSKAEWEAIENRSGDETINPGVNCLYITYPMGQGVSRLKLPKLGTARNWNTVTKLAAALREA